MGEDRKKKHTKNQAAEKSAGDNQWTSRNPAKDDRERRDGPGGEDNLNCD